MMTMASSSSNSTQSKKENYRYDVFLSFRGPDTRNTFVDHLYAHLLRKGIFVFKDDKKIQKGESIPAQLLQAIQDSRLSIIVFSQNYASSRWCLDEMAAIADCKQQSNQTVFSVFYDVDPSHVRHQDGAYKDAFDSHRLRFTEDPDKVGRWARAMTDLANSAGWDVRNKPEFREIKKIVQEVIRRLGHKFCGFLNDLIGIQSRVEALEGSLKLGLNNDNVRVLGICGMGGIGKTTQAVVLYDRISYKFDACCFIENVSKIYRDGGATAIQKQILRQTLKEENLEICSPFEISGIVRNRLHNIKVLIVLDNVDQIQQLEELAIDPDDLLEGSRMIIITTDEHILKAYGAHAIHKVSLMNDNDARKLFYSKAFKSEDQSSSCIELIPEVLKYVQGLPLAIKVIGSLLCTRNATQWKDALDSFENSPVNEIMDVLQVSVNGLSYEDKEFFLDIACFFKEEMEDYAKRILNCCGLHTDIGIPRLIEKSLITLRDQEIHMHDMLQELGKKIIRNHFPKQPGSWSRIWLYEDFFHVMTTQTGTNNVTAVVLNKKDQDMSECSVAELSKMKNLRLLILYHKSFSGNLDFLSSQLRYLLWHDYPFTSLPSRFEACCLVELNMPCSSIKCLWKGQKNFPRLKRMDLSNSKYLQVTPDFSGVPNLERLDLSGCTGLTEVHPSIGILENLVFLSFRNCNNIKIDLGWFNLISLRVLHFSGCTKLENTPDFTRTTNLEYLDFDGCTSLSSVHKSIGALAKLTFLSFRFCKNLALIPNIDAMTSLQTLDLWGCLKLKYFTFKQAFIPLSSHLKSLVFLDMCFCNLVEVPDAIGELRCLERLNLQGNNFVSIPYDSFRGLHRLAYLNLSQCHKLEALPYLPSESTSSGGRYFKTVSGSRGHRSGLYAFDCPELAHTSVWRSLYHMLVSPSRYLALAWLVRLIEEPCYFRCGFDIVVPLGLEVILPRWLLNQGFKGDSVIRIVKFNVDDNWMGFVFCVTFEWNIIRPAVSSNSPHSSHPFRLSFESEYTEECFDMSRNLELNKIYESKYVWVIYISREHCHFVKTGANITFKAHSRVKINAWGMKSIFRQDIDDLKRMQQGESLPLHPNDVVDHVDFESVEKSNNNSGPKFQLPYNWLVTEADEVENISTKAKETNLSYAGL